MLKVHFYDNADDRYDSLINFAVIVAKHDGKWVFCKQKQRDTYEVPGGHREPGEDILSAAMRELFEETGAVEYSIRPVCVYSVTGEDGAVSSSEESFGMLYFADIAKFEDLPDFEMEEVVFLSDLPDNLTYPLIQPLLIDKVNAVLFPKQAAKRSIIQNFIS